ncbi:CBS domain-containing protein [Methanomassiliicoccus luminyensis]|uniref:CBS domain-containing protein n=1 Tax=Methanomassiliicoccus luminyensis TaxID=1080712 RepID=UPI00036DC612|nr:CBS domain-containing protein [Methanomassiliicoccus luminyensis]
MSLKISEVMSSPVHTVTRDTPLSSAIRIMKEKGISRVPVVDEEGRLTGLLFWRDILYGMAFSRL